MQSKPLDILKDFSKSELLGQIQPQFLQTLATIVVPKKLCIGEMLFFQNQKATGFYLICEGTVKVFRIGADGREQLIHLFDEGEIIGEVPVFQGSAYPANAMAKSDCRLLYFGRNDFLALGRKQPEILLNILAILSRRLRHFVELIDDLSLKSVNARLAKYILRSSLKQQKDIVILDLSKGALASRLGTISATLSRTFKKLQEAGAIRVNGGTISIKDKDHLQSIAEGEKI